MKLRDFPLLTDENIDPEVVAEVCLLRRPTGVRVGHAEGRAFVFIDFLAAFVANQNCLACHVASPFVVKIASEMYR